MTLSPENRILVEVVDGWALGEECDLPLDRIDALMNAARAEATTTQAQTLATALDDLSAAEDALVSQTALVRAQGERVAELEAGIRLLRASLSGIHSVKAYLIVKECNALLSSPLQDKEGAGSVPAHLVRLANAPHVEPDHDWDGDEGREGRRDLTEDEG